MTANTGRLRKLANAIERKQRATSRDLPLRRPMPDFNMAIWGEQKSGRVLVKPRAINICHTAGCIAGSAVALFKPKTFRKALVKGYPSLGLVAEELLELHGGQTEGLFTPSVNGHIKSRHAVSLLRWFADNPDANRNSIELQWCQVLGVRD